MASLKMIFLSAVALILFLIAATIANDFLDNQNKQKAEGDYATVTLYSETGKQLKIKAEVVDTDEERATGLMFRETLGSNEGMLFVFPDAAMQNFWMKNTLIPLDMIFVAEEMTIVKIHHAVPCHADPCPLYNSGQPIKYVLEVNGNLTTAYGIQEGGSRVEIIR